MFGTLKIDRRRLDCDGKRSRSASFCAGCHALRETLGRPAALLTNHDQTVLALLLAGLERTPAPPEPRRCTAVAWRTVQVQPLSPDARRLLAAANAAAIAAKLRDDREDDGGLLPRVLLRLLRGSERRSLDALRELGFDTELLTRLGRVQRAAEHDPTAGIDRLAEASAELTGAVFAQAARVQHRDGDVEAARALGAALGRHVYGEDAWLDREADRRRRRFNAWQHVHRGAIDTGDVAGWLLAQLQAARSALARLELGAQGPVLAALLDTLEARARHIPGRHAHAELARSSEAGECDLDCCSGCDCSGGEDTACCGGCCDVLCCWSDNRAERKRRRQEQRAARVQS